MPRPGAKPQKAHALLAGILLVGWLVAFTVPKSVNGKLFVFIAVMLVAIALFARQLIRSHREKASRQEELFMERVLRERAGAAPALQVAVPAPRSAAPAPLEAQRWSLALLQRLEPRRLEELCAAYFKLLGFRVEMIRCGPGEGLDFRLLPDGALKATAAVQCHPGNPGIRPIRELVGLMALEGIPEGIFIASGAFSPEARQLASRAPAKLQLIDGPGLVEKLVALAPEKAQALLRVALAP